MDGVGNQPKLCTTHFAKDKKARVIGRPAIINGKRSIAYMKGNDVESYVPWDEAQEQIFTGNLPELTLDF